MSMLYYFKLKIRWNVYCITVLNKRISKISYAVNYLKGVTMLIYYYACYAETK